MILHIFTYTLPVYCMNNFHFFSCFFLFLLVLLHCCRCSCVFLSFSPRVLWFFTANFSRNLKFEIRRVNSASWNNLEMRSDSISAWINGERRSHPIHFWRAAFIQFNNFNCISIRQSLHYRLTLHKIVRRFIYIFIFFFQQLFPTDVRFFSLLLNAWDDYMCASKWMKSAG